MSTATVVLNIVIPDGALLAPAPVVQPEFIDTTGPLTDEQRKALFAAFRDVFGSARSGARYVFTNLILGNEPNTQVSWSTWKVGRLTRLEADYLLRSLKALSEAI